jgi:hypothetical protein
MTVQWFKRMGDIPGIAYDPPVAVDRSKLQGHDAVARVARYEFDGDINESLRWGADDAPDEDFGAGASPAHAVAFGGLDAEMETSALLKRLWEGLELPGQPSDYHFAVQGVAQNLTSRRAREPEVLEWVEYLCLLDVRLVQACPDAITNTFGGDEAARRFYSVPTFQSLIDLYTREGFLADALNVARIAKRFEQERAPVAELEERIAALRAEDGD